MIELRYPGHRIKQPSRDDIMTGLQAIRDSSNMLLVWYHGTQGYYIFEVHPAAGGMFSIKFKEWGAASFLRPKSIDQAISVISGYVFDGVKLDRHDIEGQSAEYTDVVNVPETVSFLRHTVYFLLHLQGSSSVVNSSGIGHSPQDPLSARYWLRLVLGVAGLIGAAVAIAAAVIYFKSR
ncbi:MAG: hypothetical protein ABI716_01750 [Candidatus Saccharibacteria bacterium]